jgi:hypothetical protein
MKKIKLTKHEKQSGTTRVDWAEGLILQLPANHDGRNSWLLNYGVGCEAVKLRTERGLDFIEKTKSAKTKKRLA